VLLLGEGSQAVRHYISNLVQGPFFGVTPGVREGAARCLATKMLPRVDLELVPGEKECAANRLGCSGGNFVFLGLWLGWLDFIMLPPTLHSCIKLFQTFSILDHAPTLMQSTQCTECIQQHINTTI